MLLNVCVIISSFTNIKLGKGTCNKWTGPLDSCNFLWANFSTNVFFPQFILDLTREHNTNIFFWSSTKRKGVIILYHSREGGGGGEVVKELLYLCEVHIEKYGAYYELEVFTNRIQSNCTSSGFNLKHELSSSYIHAPVLIIVINYNYSYKQYYSQL